MIKPECTRERPRDCAYFNPHSKSCDFSLSCKYQSVDILENLKTQRDYIYKLLKDADPQSREASYLNGRYGALRETVELLEKFGVGDKA